ncbi:MAG TPA: ADP-glyceromanno-heptose 6-epimerase [Opitutaceae bacterium]|jgi:ADP-L-glycero-D-manno-heptose 6-epimerase|nr:ADP-glyceromanno-heptose 6-epimerase [Opitutaceae bacterium]
MAANALNGRILVTGGAGFIGSALIWALNARGIDDIVVSDILNSDEKWRNLVPLRFAEYVEGPALRSRIAQNTAAFGKFSAVFHLGACSSTTERDASYLVDNNTNFTRELAGWSLAMGARFIYASSAATYGDGAQGMDDSDPAIERLRPLNMYGYSKHLFDLNARRLGWLDRIVGVKYFNVYGPNEDHKGDMRSLVAKAHMQIRDSGKLGLFRSYDPKYPDGGQMRDFLYVKDAVEMTLHFAEAGSQSSGLFNLGSGEANTWLTLAGAIFAALGKEPRIEFIEMPEVLKAKYQYYTKADISKLRASGYSKPVTPLAEAVADYVGNYLVPGKRLGE